MTATTTRIPFVIAITGHRDPTATGAAKAREEFLVLLEILKARMPHTPIAVMTGLAEGCDQLAAEAAVEAGVQLHTVTPGPLAPYRASLEEATLPAFDALLGKSATIVEAGTTPVSPTCNDAYTALSLHLVTHAHLLVAFWNGNDNHKPGGTADVIRSALEGGTIGNGPGMPIPVISLHAPRRSAPANAAQAGSHILTLHQDGSIVNEQQTSWEPLWQRCAGLDAVNADMTAHESDADLGCLIYDEATRHPVLDRTPALKPLLRIFKRFDASAAAAQQRRTRALTRILWLAGFSALFAQLYSGPIAHAWLLLVAILLVLVALILYRAVKKEHLEEQYIDHRVTAEALRIMLFLEIAGAREIEVAPGFAALGPQGTAIRDVLTGSELIRRGLPIRNDMEVTRKEWVDGQAGWYAAKAPVNAKSSQRCSRLAAQVFTGAVVSVLLTLILHALDEYYGIGLPEWAIPAMTVVYGMGFAIAAEIKLYAQIRAYEENAHRYHDEMLAFQQHARRLRNAETGQTAILASLARHASAEHIAWWETHRARPIEVPLGA